MKTRQPVVVATGLGTLVIAALLLAGCDAGYSPSYPLATPTPTVPVLNATLQPTADALALEAYQTAQALDNQARIAEMTMQAARERAERQYQVLTVEAQMTAETHQREMERQALQATATAQERDYRATATRQAREEEQTRQALDATRAAEATMGALAFQATITCQAWEGRQTATAESARATQAAYDATQQAYRATATRQAQQREEVLAYGRDYGIPLVLLIVAGGIGGLVVYWVRQHAKRPVVIQRDLRGDAPSLALPGLDGGWNLVDLDRQPGHVTRLLPSGESVVPQFRSAGQEERTTARDQLVDATTRPQLGARRGSTRPPALPVAPPPQPPAPGLRRVAVLRRLDQAAVAGMLPPGVVAALQADWEEE